MEEVTQRIWRWHIRNIFLPKCIALFYETLVLKRNIRPREYSNITRILTTGYMEKVVLLGKRYFSREFDVTLIFSDIIVRYSPWVDLESLEFAAVSTFLIFELFREVNKCIIYEHVYIWSHSQFLLTFVKIMIMETSSASPHPISFPFSCSC